MTATLQTILPGESRPPDATQLRQLVENGGLHYEAKLARLAGAADAPAADSPVADSRTQPAAEKTTPAQVGPYTTPKTKGESDLSKSQAGERAPAATDARAEAAPAHGAGVLRVEAVMRDVTERKKLDDQARELAILRVSQLNGADYQFQIHATKYAPEAGLSTQQVAALDNSEHSNLFQPAHRALLAYTDAMTLDIDVPDGVFDKLKPHYSNAQIVELTILIGAYNMHTRVGRALRIDPEAS